MPATKEEIDSHNHNEDETSVRSIDNVASPSILKVLSLAKPEWSILLVALLLMIIGEAVNMYTPILLGYAYDDLVDPTLDSNDRMSSINQSMIVIMILHTGSIIASFLRLALMQIVGERVVARLRITLYSSILKQEISFFDTHKSGELISRLSSDTTLLQTGASQALPELLVSFIQTLVALGLMVWISVKLAGVLLGFVVIVLCICVPFFILIAKYSKQYQDMLGDAQGYSTETLQAMRTVQSFGAETVEVSRYASKIGDPDQYHRFYPSLKNPKSTTTAPSNTKGRTETNPTTYSVGYWKAIVETGLYDTMYGLGFGGMLLTLWYGFKLVNDGEITLGQLTAFETYIFIIGELLAQTSTSLTQLIEAKGVAGRVFYLLERLPTISRSGGETTSSDGNGPSLVPPQTTTAIEASIGFHNVTFAYPSRLDTNVLKNFTLSISPNQTVALVGASGSGKSTCLALLQRFYDTNSGYITIDGQDIRTLDLKWLRSQIAFVQQEPQIFGLTIRENIVYGVHDRVVSQDEIEEAARQANAHDFIMQMPLQYESLVGERGVQLSGGQKQRIAIARALIRKPQILLLDEATSALDAESEYAVQEAINNAIVGRTVLIVAHRLSTIQHADQIVVVHEHQILDTGTHHELLQRCSKYQELIQRQSLS